MKKTALTANVGLLLALAGYFLTIADIDMNGLELLLLVFALASPVVSVPTLLTNRLSSRAMRLLIALPNAALLTTLCVYLINHQPLQGLDLVTDWPVLLTLACMLVAPALSLLAIAVIRAEEKSNTVPTDAACPTDRG